MKKFSFLENGVVKINTRSIDYLNDEIIVYKNNQKYTDDGYYWNEMQMWGTAKEKERKEIAKIIASWYGCEFDEETGEFYCEIIWERGISPLVQTITAVCTWINLLRIASNK